jgi:hypothetical protein
MTLAVTGTDVTAVNVCYLDLDQKVARNLSSASLEVWGTRSVLLLSCRFISQSEYSLCLKINSSQSM